MRFRISVVMVAAVLVLAGCRGHEALTGGYGDRGVAGVVTMAAGMSNSSPAGVRVTVRGTGMSAVLGTDGRFAFFGVPENADLVFTRDDVNARLSVPPSAASLVVELDAHTASTGRHRTVPTGPQLQLEGTVKSISPAEIVVTTEHGGDVSAKITDTTFIVRGDTPIHTTDIHVGDRVHVKVNVATDGTRTAAIIMLQAEDNGHNEDPAGEEMSANGTVTAVGSGQLTVSTEAHGLVTVKVDANTVIKKQDDHSASLSDIKVNDQVNCQGKRIDDHTMLARQIEVRGVSGHH